MSDPGVPQPPVGPGAEDIEPEHHLSRKEQMKAQQARLTRQAQNARAKLEAARPKNPAIDAVMRAVERDVASGGGVLAGAVAFRIFMFMVPFVFLLVGVFGLGSSASDQDPQDLARKAGITGIVAKAFSSVGELSLGERIVMVVVVGFATFLATRALIKVLRIVHALVWHERAGKVARPTRAAGALIGIVFLAMALAGFVGYLRGQSFIIGLIATLLYVAIPTSVWVFVSWHLPHPDLPWTALIPGAVIFGLGLEGLHLVTVYWIAHEVENKTETYGAIGFALALLLWAYLIGRLITTAAVVNESLWTRNQERLAARREQTRRDQTRRGGPEGPPRIDDRSAWED